MGGAVKRELAQSDRSEYSYTKHYRSVCSSAGWQSRKEQPTCLEWFRGFSEGKPETPRSPS